MVAPGILRHRLRRGFTLVEVSIALTVALLVIGAAFALHRFATVSTQQTLGPQLGLQTASRAALVQFIREIQESIEIVRPAQGCTLNYFVARDKLNQFLVGYVAPKAGAAGGGGTDPALQELYLYRHDYDHDDPARQQRKVLDGVERITFTTLSPGVLQIHMTLWDQGRDYTLLTTVRARNILAEGEL